MHDDPVGTPDPVDLLIANVSVLSTTDEGYEIAHNREIAIRNGAIVAIEPVGTVPCWREHLDGDGALAIPGLVNGHTHSPMVMYRGIAADVTDERWFNEFMFPMEHNVRPADAALAAELAMAEMLLGGVTTFADHYEHMSAIAPVVERVGIRGILGDTFYSSEGSMGRARSLRFALDWAGAADGRITTMLAPHATYTVDEDDLRWLSTAALDHLLPIHIHASENAAQVLASRRRDGRSPIDVLHDTGVLGAGVHIAHGTGIDDLDRPVLEQHVTTVSLATSPKAYAKWWGHDTTPIRMLREIGIPVALATDGAASNGTLDIWESMMLTAITQKSAEGDPEWMSAQQVLDLATTQGAAAVRLGSLIGQLEVGRQADVALVDLTAPHARPVHDHASTLVYSARSSDVTATVVAGRVLMRNRQLTTIDVDDVAARLDRCLPRLIDRDHGDRIQEYVP